MINIIILFTLYTIFEIVMYYIFKPLVGISDDGYM